MKRYRYEVVFQFNSGKKHTRELKALSEEAAIAQARENILGKSRLRKYFSTMPRRVIVTRLGWPTKRRLDRP